MKEKYLPVGSVVTLNGATKRLMIIGYCPINEKNQMYDYSACPFPMGLVSPKNLLAFNHDQIEQINQLGIEDEEYQDINKALTEYVKLMENMKNINLPNNENKNA